ncbi:MAG: S9 family peptidase, partial [Gemmatimonadetes bacterium]|nr:S9 family peptidase [Gemmatimonadota bacterium]NIS02500.1 S9 family peptidase [Gemmatimonadota bacterium]NIT69078.1 S9 family peptidase [Gemmatimonadota bacterium]NIU54312.1 S9 family peptidase [Gemmatimonadota bacterium]NIV22492.1 S9 family peptidase [Gemmatimonadota bacterium]
SFTEDRRPVSYYVYDRATQQGEMLFYSRPELAEYTLAPMEPIELRASDGLELHGYLTVPSGVERNRL